MLFMIPHIQHRPQLSSLDDCSDESRKVANKRDNSGILFENENFKRQKNDSTKQSTVLNEIEKNTHILSSLQDSLSNRVKEQGPKTGFKKYKNLIRTGFEKVPEHLKYKCCREILLFIEEFKSQYEC